MTVNLRKRPTRQIQPEYRPTHAINCAQVCLRYGLQSQMMAATISSQWMFNDGIRLMEEMLHCGTMIEEDEVADELAILLAFNEHCISPTYQYYMLQEMNLCDIPPEMDDFRFEYTPWRKRTIASLTDYEALTFCNFTKGELRRLLNCFQFPGEIRVECYAKKCYCFA